MDVKEHGAGGIRYIGDVGVLARQIPNQPGIHRAEEQFARLRSNPCAGHVAQNPLDLTAAEIGVRNQAGLFADDFARAFRLESFNLGGGAAALPDNGVANRLARRFIPDDRGFALIGDADAHDVLRVDCRLFNGLFQ